MNYNQMSQREKNEVVKQYEPLVNKMIRQFFDKGVAPWDQIKSMAYEGLVLAMINYDEERSSMNFTQFAAFAIRNNILTCLDNETRTVKLSAYAQKKAVENGEAVFNTVRVDFKASANDDNRKPLEVRLGMFEDEKFSNGDVLEYLCTRLENQFTEIDCKIFYMSFGLKGYEEMKGKDIAAELGLHECIISQKKKKIIEWIRKDNNLCEVLASLM